MNSYHLDHLEYLETEAIHIMREVAAEFERPALLFSGGKDSICLLRLAEKAFRPSDIPMPFLNVETGHEFPELIEFRDRRAAQLGAKLIIRTVDQAIANGTAVPAPGEISRNKLQIPVLLGASSFIQQRLMPPQGDPAQQKMMMYMMPGIFTVMMLFLPAGLGVYMMTNTWLGILQQVLMEKYMSTGAPPSSGIEVREKKTPGDETSTPSLGKGKASVRG